MLLFQNFAENTMNELLGWYGYDKVELKDGEDIEFRSYTTDGESRQHISVLKGKDVWRLFARAKSKGPSPPARTELLWVSLCYEHN